MYDVMENGFLDLYSLREVFKKAYTNHIVNLEEAMREIKNAVAKEDDMKE